MVGVTARDTISTSALFILLMKILKNISALIEDAIADKTFCRGNELVEMIEARYPYILRVTPDLYDGDARCAEVPPWEQILFQG